jgi:predicted PurR-regulated permease PerM
VGYIVIGVPQALVLGLLTTLAALIPSIGTGLVWVPVTVALFLSGRNGAGIALLVVGCVVSVADNIIRPWLSRYGHLQLPTFVVLVSMLGGIGVFGPWGVLLGPLLVRLAVEALAIWQDEQGAAPRRRSRPSGVNSSPLSERQPQSTHA